MTAIQNAKAILKQNFKENGVVAATGIGVINNANEAGVTIRVQDPTGWPDTYVKPDIIQAPDKSGTIVDVMVGPPVFIGVVKPIPALIQSIGAILPGAKSFQEAIDASYRDGLFPHSTEKPTVIILKSRETLYENFINSSGEMESREIEEIDSYVLYFDPKLEAGADSTGWESYKKKAIPTSLRGISWHHNGIYFPLFTKNHTPGRTRSTLEHLVDPEFFSIDDAEKEAGTVP